MSASEIILERLKTHPEEFVSLAEGIKMDGKWSPLLESLNDWASPEENNSIANGIIQAKRLLADQIALQILSGEYIQPPTLKYQHPYNSTMNSSTLTLNTSQKMSEIQLRRMMEIQKEYDKLQQGATITLTGKAK